ncbi:MAG: 4Fe-4S binding protein [Candidatus Thermoplasmatota archaeon]
MTAPIAFDMHACDRNPYCPVTRVCPTGAMHIDRRTYSPAFDASKCTGCGTCLTSCPHGAVRAD